jgi:c-di-GMP-binding flagellar brake protein YcgR
MGGMFLQTEEIEDIGVTGEIIIHLIIGEEKKDIRALCRVVRNILPSAENTDQGMGVEIVNIDPDSSILLYNLIKYQDIG